MAEPLFGRETYMKWFVAQPMSDAAKAGHQRRQREKQAAGSVVHLTHNAAWIVFLEFYGDSFSNARIKPSTLTRPQILLAQQMLLRLLDGRRGLGYFKAIAEAALMKRPASAAGLAVIAFNFLRKLPRDTLTAGMPSQAEISALLERSDLKSFVARTYQPEVEAEFGIPGQLRSPKGTTFF